jgi:hypothetical protein
VFCGRLADFFFAFFAEDLFDDDDDDVVVVVVGKVQQPVGFEISKARSSRGASAESFMINDDVAGPTAVGMLIMYVSIVIRLAYSCLLYVRYFG